MITTNITKKLDQKTVSPWFFGILYVATYAIGNQILSYLIEPFYDQYLFFSLFLIFVCLGANSFNPKKWNFFLYLGALVIPNLIFYLMDTSQPIFFLVLSLINATQLFYNIFIVDPEID